MVTTEGKKNNVNTSPRISKRCRAFVNRLRETVQVASEAWSYSYDVAPSRYTCPFLPSRTCSDEMAEVKRFLGCSPSGDPVFDASFQSIKKLLPDSCKCMESKMLDNLVAGLSTPSPDPPPGFLQFVDREVSRLFPKAWDTSYDSWCRVTSPPLSSVFGERVAVNESGEWFVEGCGGGGVRSSGGSLGAFERSGFSQSEYLDAVFGRVPLPERLSGSLIVVQSSGKPRPLSKFDKEGLFLKPLHKTIYSFLSRKKWLCRGDVDERKLKEAGFSSFFGGVLTSGDYKSATDGLFRSVSRRILSSLLSNAACVPASVREYALSSLDPLLFRNLGSPLDPDWVSVPAVRGQMMGSYLSFPLLCLVNYLAFRWVASATGESPPVIINGDDILFQSSPEFSQAWMEFVPLVGLEVEKVKTGVDPCYGSLNSTLFSWGPDGLLTRRRTLRFGMLRQQTVPNSLGFEFRDFVAGLEGQVRWRAAVTFFEYHSGTMRNFQYSLPSLGFRGALAHRLSRKFGLLYHREDVAVPAREHGVELPADLISLVPRDVLTQEQKSFSSDETAAWKWGFGFKTVNLTQEAIRWALKTSGSSSWKSGFQYAPVFWCSDSEFRFRLKNAREEEKVSRRCVKSSFLSPLPKREFDRILSSVFDCLDFDLRGELPTYSESVGRSDEVANPPAYCSRLLCDVLKIKAHEKGPQPY